MKATNEGLALLSDESGVPYGQIEIATGRVMTLTGAYTGTTLDRHGPSSVDKYPDDGDALMSDLAGRYNASQVAKAVGHPVRMRDARGVGQLVTMDLGVTDVHIPSAMPNYAAGYTLADGVADIAMPVIMAPKQQDKFFTWDSANAFKRVLPTSASAGGAVGEVNPTLSNASYTTQEYALASVIPTEVEANADSPLRPFEAATVRVMNALRLEREIRVQAKLTASGSWDANNVIALGATAMWNNGSTSDPLKNLQDLKEKSLMRLTRLIFTEPAYHAFVRNPAVKSYWAFKADDGLVVPDPAKISAVLRLPPIVVADMKYTSGGVATYVWPAAAGASSAVVAVHEPPQNPPTSQQDVATSYTFRWAGGSAPDGTITAGFLVRSFYDPKRGPRGSRYLVIVHNDAEVMTSTVVGGLITGVIQ